MCMVFSADERLYRAIRPIDIFWKKEGKISSAAFKDSQGLSCDRDMGRIDVSSCVCSLLKFLQRDETVVSISYRECIDVNATLEYEPIDGNEYHSLILNNHEKRQLTDSQAKKLSKLVHYDYLDAYGRIVYQHD